MVTHQLQIERRTVKVRQSETDDLPLCYAANQIAAELSEICIQQLANELTARAVKRISIDLPGVIALNAI